jgi:hypothetical protein
LALVGVEVCATPWSQSVPHAEDVSQFIAEQAVAVPGEVEDNYKAFTHSLDIASDAGEVQVA